MPRPIANIGVGNPATYTLSANEAFTVTALTFVTHELINNPPYGYPSVEWRDATGGLIYRQTLNDLYRGLVSFSLSANGEPWYVSNNGQFGFPQDTEQQGNASLSARIPLIPLESGCTVTAQVTSAVLNDSEPAGVFLSPDYEVRTLHLWVQDAGARKVLPPEPPPLLTHVAA